MVALVDGCAPGDSVDVDDAVPGGVTAADGV
jgi:hypothetical protein